MHMLERLWSIGHVDCEYRGSSRPTTHSPSTGPRGAPRHTGRVAAPCMPAAYQFTRRDEQSWHKYTFTTDSETGGLVMTAPNGTGHEGARLYGSGEGPEHWLKVRPLDSPRANTGRCATPTKTARAPSRPPRAAGCATTRSTAPGTTPRERRGRAAQREGGSPPRQRPGATASSRPTAAPTARPGKRRRHDERDGVTAAPRPAHCGGRLSLSLSPSVPRTPASALVVVPLSLNTTQLKLNTTH